MNKISIDIMNCFQIQEYACIRKNIIISISDKKEDLPYLEHQTECIGKELLTFLDVDKESYDEKLFPHNGCNEYHAKRILSLLNQHIMDIETIICQCDAGISRSAGVAVALTNILYGIGEEDYFYKHYIPNELVKEKILREFYTYENSYLRILKWKTMQK